LLKSKILEENIYGVDLDQQAVEITRLNLLINALHERIKLPLLDNIKNGNSLISGTDEELKKYFGKNFRDKKPFNWQEEFPKVFKQGGFDVIIGNPPYIDIRKINNDEKKYLFEKFNCTKNRANTFSIFIEKSLFLLKRAGYLSFIIPNTILTHSSYKKLRKEILNQSLIVSIFDPGKNVFEKATVETIVLTLNKNKNSEKQKNNNIKIIKKDLEQQEYYLKQKLFSTSDGQKFLLYNPQNSKVISKIKKHSIDLGEIYHGYNGINPGNQKSSLVIDKKIDERYKKVIDGKNIKRFSIKWGGNYILYDKKILERARNENIFLAKPKIMLQKIGMNLVGGLDTEKLYALINTTILLNKSNNYNEKFILALINSKLLNYFYKKEFLGVQIMTEFLEKIPVHKIDFSDKKEKEKHDSLVKWVDKMLELNKELQKTTENSEKWNSIKSEIKKTDKKIDEEVYKLYDLTPEEIKIIEAKE